MKKISLLITLAFVIQFYSYDVPAQQSPKEKGLETITIDAIMGQLEFLASDWMEGRATGERGSFLAADYVASMFRVFGAAPAGDPGFGGPGARPPLAAQRQGTRAGVSQATRSYFQNFSLIELLPGGKSTLTVTKAGRAYIFEENVDFTVTRSFISTRFESPVVFAGYGIVDKELGINDFAGIDVRGKVVLRLAGFPGSNDINSPMYKKIAGDSPRTAFEINRRKNETLASLGAAAVIEISPAGDVAKRWGTYKFDYNLSPAESNVSTNWTTMRLDGKEVPATPLTIALTERALNLILKDSGIDPAKFEKEAAAGTTKFKPFQIPGLTVSLETDIRTRRVNVRNVIAMIEGENPDEIVVAGAHMDHMGMDNGKIWNGADDNASGTVGIMTLARAFAASGVKPKRTILFCAWTGEEKGLLGSEYFTMYPTIGKISNYKFYLNFDMIARDAANDTARNMAGMTYWTPRPQLYLEALLAGNDLLLFVRRMEETVRFLEACVEDGRLPEKVVDDRCLRVLRMKAMMGLHARRWPAESDEEAASRLASSPYRSDARQVAERSVTLLRDSGNLVPLRLPAGSRIASVLITHLADFTLDVFDTTLRQVGYAVASIKNPQTDQMCDRVTAGEFDLVIMSVYYPTLYGWGTTRVHGPDSRVVMSGFPVANPQVPAVYISFANPYAIYEFAFMDPYLVTYGGCAEAQRAAALALSGKIPIQGKIPCGMPGFFAPGDGIIRPVRI